MDRYAVMGNPISHSKSPQIHSAFASQTGEDLQYTAIHVEAGLFPSAVSDFFSQGGKGLNVSVPFKQEAWQLAVKHSEDARLAGAVNTLLMSEGSLYGHNTDGIGLVRDIKANYQGVLHNKRILILGAGGAGRGILLPFLREQPDLVHIANRTASKADTLAAEFAMYGKLASSGFSELEGEQFDWVINATSASLGGEMPPLPDNLLAADAWCYDLMYSKEPTVFCRWADSVGAARVMDGLGMLVEQAAESFYLWRKVRPETGSILKRLRQAM